MGRSLSSYALPSRQRVDLILGIVVPTSTAGYMATKQYALAAGICMEKLWVGEGIVGLRTWNNERRVRHGGRALAGVPLNRLLDAGPCR